MKKLSQSLKMICLAVLITACSSDDPAPNTSFSYLPLQVNNSWNYTITTGNQTSTDVLKVDALTGNKYTLGSNPSPGNGVMTNFLTSGDLEERDGKIVLNGVFSLTELGFGDLNINVANGVINDQNVADGNTTYTTSGSFNQTVSNFPLVITYTARNVQRADRASMTVNGTTYSNVEHAQFIINATITTPITVAGITQNITVLQSQDVITIDNYWARDIGLIQSDNLLDYTLEDFSAFGVVLPVPQSASFTSTQAVTSYTIN